MTKQFVNINISDIYYCIPRIKIEDTLCNIRFDHDFYMVSDTFYRDCGIEHNSLSYDYLLEDNLMFEPITQRQLLNIWISIFFYILCFCICLTTLRVLSRSRSLSIFERFNSSKIIVRREKNEEDDNILEEMERFLDEISELSEEKRYELSDKYYILTNMMANKFRIHVYQKILK